MADTGLPPHNPGLYQETQAKIEIVKPAPKIKSNLPEYIQIQADEIINGTKEKKEIELKIESIFKKLEEKYGDNFERGNFKIEKTILSQKETDYLGYELFLLSDKNGIELSYINNTGEIIIEFSKIELNTFKHNLIKKATGHSLGRKENGRLFIQLKDNSIHYPNTEILINFLLKYKNIEPKKN